MGEIETLGVLQEIQSLVSDQLQVVSYKWLSRNFLVSSNAAKRLLQKFVETHQTGLEVVYTLSGWLKDNPACYHITLVSGTKLEEAKEAFDRNCSIQVYSVQGCIPRDPAALWNAEFVQAEELFRQPSSIDNCLRDNRFCGISNSFVKRHVDGTPVSTAALQSKIAPIPGPSTSKSRHPNNAVPPPQQIKVQQPSPNVDLQSPSMVKDVKDESDGSGVNDQAAKPAADKKNNPPQPANKKRGQGDKSSSGSEGSLANLWGRASTKSKPISASAHNNNIVPNPPASAEAQISVCEAIEDISSDDDAENVNFKRASNGEGSRKRRVVLDYSDDEYEETVNLASPDSPTEQSNKYLYSEKVNSVEQKEDELKVKEEKSTKKTSDQCLKEDSSKFSKSIKSKTSSSGKMNNNITTDDNEEDKVTNGASTSPKRRKVLKTWIDERGREVTEVVWEGEGEVMETKKAETNPTKEAEKNSVADTANRPSAAKKSPAVGTTAPATTGSKAGNKKGANKDPKQGNILSFFKRV